MDCFALRSFGTLPISIALREDRLLIQSLEGKSHLKKLTFRKALNLRTFVNGFEKKRSNSCRDFLNFPNSPCHRQRVIGSSLARSCSFSAIVHLLAAEFINRALCSCRPFVRGQAADTSRSAAVSTRYYSLDTVQWILFTGYCSLDSI